MMNRNRTATITTNRTPPWIRTNAPHWGCAHARHQNPPPVCLARTCRPCLKKIGDTLPGVLGSKTGQNPPQTQPSKANVQIWALIDRDFSRTRCRLDVKLGANESSIWSCRNHGARLCAFTFQAARFQMNSLVVTPMQVHACVSHMHISCTTPSC